MERDPGTGLSTINYPSTAWIDFDLKSPQQAELCLLSDYYPMSLADFLQSDCSKNAWKSNNKPWKNSDEVWHDSWTRLIIAQTICAILGQVDELHGVQCVHRDLKPSNILGQVSEVNENDEFPFKGGLRQRKWW